MARRRKARQRGRGVRRKYRQRGRGQLAGGRRRKKKKKRVSTTNGKTVGTLGKMITSKTGKRMTKTAIENALTGVLDVASGKSSTKSALASAFKNTGKAALTAGLKRLLK